MNGQRTPTYPEATGAFRASSTMRILDGRGSRPEPSLEQPRNGLPPTSWALLLFMLEIDLQIAFT